MEDSSKENHGHHGNDSQKQGMNSHSTEEENMQSEINNQHISNSGHSEEDRNSESAKSSGSSSRSGQNDWESGSADLSTNSDHSGHAQESMDVSQNTRSGRQDNHNENLGSHEERRSLSRSENSESDSDDAGH